MKLIEAKQALLTRIPEMLRRWRESCEEIFAVESNVGRVVESSTAWIDGSNIILFSLHLWLNAGGAGRGQRVVDVAVPRSCKNRDATCHIELNNSKNFAGCRWEDVGRRRRREAAGVETSTYGRIIECEGLADRHIIDTRIF